MSDWIDKEHEVRLAGGFTALDQSQHTEVNARYPGCTLEYCCKCSQPTGRAGQGEDSLYADDSGPYCWDCWKGLEVDE